MTEDKVWWHVSHEENGMWIDNEDITGSTTLSGIYAEYIIRNVKEKTGIKGSFQVDDDETTMYFERYNDECYNVFECVGTIYDMDLGE